MWLCKTTNRKAKDPQSQPVVEGNNTLVAAPRKYDRFQAAEAHLPDGVVKEEIRERVANKAKQLEAKRRMLAELEVATLVAAHALKKGKAAAAAAAAAAAVAEECRAAEAEVLEARASISASLAAAVPEVPDSLVAASPQSRAIEEKTSASSCKRAAWRGDKRRSEGPVGMSFHVSCWDTVREFLTRVECMVLFLQEPKLVGDARREAGSWSWCSRHGWESFSRCKR